MTSNDFENKNIFKTQIFSILRYILYFNLPLIGVIYSNIYIVQQVYTSIYGKGAKTKNHFICASKGFHLKLAKALSIIFAKLSQAKPQLQLSWLALASLNFT